MENNSLKINRFNPPIDFGLNTQEIKSRLAEGLINVDKSVSTKPTSKIIKDNVLTLFNLINIILAIAVLCVGSYRNLMFMGVVICNAIIGIIQEIRAKKTVEKLNLISSSHATVLRNGKKRKIKIEQVVLDDIILFEPGNQIVADSIIKSGKCEVNESLLTGEPDLIVKKPGDMLLSGSYIVSGTCTAQTENVGKNNYSSTILKGLKYIKKTKSEIMTTVNKIIKIISIAIIPIGALLFYRQLTTSSYDYTSAIITTTAALTGMIPEGLVLLTSSILAVGVIKLSKHKVLVQDIYCLETLARVNTLCLDKTGTITEGTFEVEKLVPESSTSTEELKASLSALTSVLNDTNETFKAIKNYVPKCKENLKVKEIIPFSSERKWSGAEIEGKGTIIMGAGEFIFGKNYSTIKDKIKNFSDDYRILTVVHSENNFQNGNIPENINLIGFVLIKDKIRKSAEKTLKFFKKQGVDIKVISGDNPVTVSKIAKRVNLNNYESYIDVSQLKTDEEIQEAAKKYTIFGRVTPPQKQQIIKTLKSTGKTVAMVGDGVNDVLAMKESDCSVAMASGSDIARNISHIVLINSNFSAMPHAVAEGRIAINNIQRSSSLFLVKTIYSCLLSLLFLFIPAPYPFIPIQMTLISAITIGIPSFILALEPNRERISGNLFKNIISKALPAALTVMSGLILCIGLYFLFDLSYEKYSTLAVIITGFIGTALLYKISVPLNKLRTSLLWFVVISFSIGIFKYSNLFVLEPFNIVVILLSIALILISVIIYDYVSKINLEKIFKLSKK